MKHIKKHKKILATLPEYNILTKITPYTNTIYIDIYNIKEYDYNMYNRSLRKYTNKNIHTQTSNSKYTNNFRYTSTKTI
jgi:hypothetical protein